MSDLKDIATAALNRLRHPVLGTFSVTWLIVHWKVPVFLLDSGPADARIPKAAATITCESNRIAIVATALLLLVLPFLQALVEAVRSLAEELRLKLTRKTRDRLHAIASENLAQARRENLVNREKMRLRSEEIEGTAAAIAKLRLNFEETEAAGKEISRQRDELMAWTEERMAKIEHQMDRVEAQKKEFIESIMAVSRDASPEATEKLNQAFAALLAPTPKDSP